MALPATDTFTTDISQTLTSYSSNWTMAQGVMRVDAGEDTVGGYVDQDESCAYWNADSFSADQYSQVTIAGYRTGYGAFGVAVRASSGTYYGLYTDSSDTYLFKYVSNTWIQIGPTGAKVNNGSILRLEVSGASSNTTLTPKTDGSVSDIGQQTGRNDGIGSGSAGLAGWDNEYLNTCATDWEGGNLSSTTTYTRTVTNVAAALKWLRLRSVASAVASLSYRIGRPEADITTGSWGSTPLWDKVDDP